ncbi:hypothetical protein D3C80_1762710 [compost metagenome]
MRRLDGAAGVGLAHVGHLGDDLTRGRVEHRELAPVMGLAPVTIYIGKGFEQGVSLSGL